MYNIENAVFSNISSSTPAIYICSSPSNQAINISLCHIENVIVLSSTDLAAIVIKEFLCNIKFVNTIKCKGVVDGLANAIQIQYGSVVIDHLLVDKCVENIASAESAVLISNSQSLKDEHTNFTNCVAKTDPKFNGAPSIECTGVSTCQMKYTHIADGSGYKGILLNKGAISFVNILRFKGNNLLEGIEKASNCCFFDVTINALSDSKVNLVNCFSDNKLVTSTTRTTQIPLATNAMWRRTAYCDQTFINFNKFLYFAIFFCIFLYK